MARITFGSIITSINGSIGGITYQTNKSGAIARLRPTNPKKPTSKQSSSIAEFSNLGNIWSTITPAQKVLWNDFAEINPKVDRFGALKILTGYNYFISLNFWVLKLGGVLLSNPPDFSVPAPSTDYTITLIGDEILLTSITGPSTVGLFYIIYGTTIVTTFGRSNFNKSRFLTTIPVNQVLPFALTPFWDNVFGLDFSAVNLSSNFNLSFMIQVVDIDKGITTAGLFKTFSN